MWDASWSLSIKGWFLNKDHLSTRSNEVFGILLKYISDNHNFNIFPDLVSVHQMFSAWKTNPFVQLDQNFRYVQEIINRGDNNFTLLLMIGINVYKCIFDLTDCSILSNFVLILHNPKLFPMYLFMKIWLVSIEYYLKDANLYI